jgi:hypothetical protein
MLKINKDPKFAKINKELGDLYQGALFLYHTQKPEEEIEDPTPQLADKIRHFTEAYEDKLFSIKEPYLNPKGPNSHDLTLVLDLDETLVHYYENENYFVIRPGC